MGENLRISAPAHDVLLFVDGVIDIDSSVPVEETVSASSC